MGRAPVPLRVSPLSLSFSEEYSRCAACQLGVSVAEVDVQVGNENQVGLFSLRYCFGASSENKLSLMAAPGVMA